jgi:hypothetical protein
MINLGAGRLFERSLVSKRNTRSGSDFRKFSCLKETKRFGGSGQKGEKKRRNIPMLSLSKLLSCLCSGNVNKVNKVR